MTENKARVIVPAIHPNCAKHHANDNTPDPITAVIICALALFQVPLLKPHKQNINNHIEFHRYKIVSICKIYLESKIVFSKKRKKRLHLYMWSELTCSFYSSIIVELLVGKIPSFCYRMTRHVLLYFSLFFLGNLMIEYRGKVGGNVEKWSWECYNLIPSFRDTVEVCRWYL